MSDLVDRIRARPPNAPPSTERLLDEAADEIERLRETLDIATPPGLSAEDLRDPKAALRRDMEAIVFREARPKTMTARQGWECPKCGRVYSPLSAECRPCNFAVYVALHPPSGKAPCP